MSASPPRPSEGEPGVEIIAEVANAHQGSPKGARQLAEAALTTGATAVKFQIYFADELLVRRHPRFDHFDQQAFSAAAWRDLIARLQDREARVYCDVFGMRALELALGADVQGFKVHSSDLGNEPLLRALAGVGRRVMLAVGGSTYREIAAAVTLLTERGARPVLMHGFQSYPTSIEDTRLGRLTRLREIFGGTCDVGYMDHVDAEDPFAVTLPVLALGLGATVIEKHITLDRAVRGVDYYSSLNPDEFTGFVRTIRRAEQAVGRYADRFAPSEANYRREVKKHWVTAREMRSGEVIEQTGLVMKRADEPKDVPDVRALVGRPLLDDRPAEYVLTRADVPNRVWALVVSRMQSSRMPGKALVDVDGTPALAHLFARLKQATRVDHIVLCTTNDDADDPLANLARKNGVDVHRGETEDVLARMLGAIGASEVDVILRVTGDDILIDPDYVDRAVDHHLHINAEYTDMKQLPGGTEVEVFDVELLRFLADAAVDTSGTEYLTYYVARHRDQFRTSHGPVDPQHRRDWRLTLDTPDDLQVIRTFLTAMRKQGRAVTYRMDDVVEFFTQHPDVLRSQADEPPRRSLAVERTDVAWTRLDERR